MTSKPPILAAISAAIGAYLAAEEEAAAAAAALPPALAAAVPGPLLSLWGLAGRQQAMQQRLLMQRRSLR